TSADLLEGDRALLPAGYYTMGVPALLRSSKRDLSPVRRAELDLVGAACRERSELSGMVQVRLERLFPSDRRQAAGSGSLEALLAENGFDPHQHESIRTDLRAGRIGLAQNRLSPSTQITDVREQDVIDTRRQTTRQEENLGRDALAAGSVGVVTLAA